MNDWKITFDEDILAAHYNLAVQQVNNYKRRYFRTTMLSLNQKKKAQSGERMRLCEQNFKSDRKKLGFIGYCSVQNKRYKFPQSIILVWLPFCALQNTAPACNDGSIGKFKRWTLDRVKLWQNSNATLIHSIN